MYVTYQPEGGEKQQWRFDPKRVRASKAEMIEKRYGSSWGQWQAAVQQQYMKARRVLLWHLLTLEHPAMRFEDTPDFMDSEFLVEYELHELRDLREKVSKASMPEDQKESIFAQLDAEITEAIEREEAKGVEPEGKANSSNGENTTPSLSPNSSTSAPGSNASA